MKFIFLIALIISLQISVMIHLQSMIGYISKKSTNYFRGFLISAVSNSLIGITLAVFVMLDRDALRGLNVNMILLLEVGFIFFYMLGVQVMVIIRILTRLRNPENYHLSHFGKKVYHTSIVGMRELVIFLLSMPFIIMAGGYFIAKIFNL